jgi:hypothetical protein
MVFTKPHTDNWGTSFGPSSIPTRHGKGDRTSGKVRLVTFEESDLAAMAAEQEVDIETRSAAGDVHRTIIWVVEHGGTVYARSYKGLDGRWFREALADPDVAIHVDGRRVPARAVPATDPASIEACSQGLRDKYPADGSLAAMLVDGVLPTTIKLVPA